MGDESQTIINILEAINEKLSIIIQLQQSQVNKTDLCKHLALRPSTIWGDFTTTSANGIRHFQVMECESCHKQLSIEKK